MEVIEIGSARSSGPGVAKGKLKVADLPDGLPMEIPVIIVRGARPGKTLWLHGCVHGNEYCGTFIIHELVRSLAPADLAGMVVALPILNITAFQKNQRMSPFEMYGGGDLNRCFPGQADGSLTQQIAHRVYLHLKRHANYLVTPYRDDAGRALGALCRLPRRGRPGRRRHRAGLRLPQYAGSGARHPRRFGDDDGGARRNPRQVIFEYIL